MKFNFRLLFIIPSLCFWISLTDLYPVTLVLFGIFGIGSGLLIAKFDPLSELLGMRKPKKTLVILLSAILSGIFSAYAGQFFRNTWSASAKLQGFITMITPNWSLALLVISIGIALGMFPFVFDVMTRVLYHGYHMLRSINLSSLWANAKQCLTVKSFLKKFILVAISLVLATVIGIGLLTAVFLIPTDRIEENLKQSALTIKRKGLIPPSLHGLSPNSTTGPTPSY